MESHPYGLLTLTCAFCGKEVQVPAVLDDGEVVQVVEDGKVFRSRLKHGKLTREPDPMPAYHIDCFDAAFGKWREDERTAPNT